MEKLTEDQRNPLFDLIKYQRLIQAEILFLVDNGDIYPDDFTAEPTAWADDALIGLWEKCSYVYLHRLKLDHRTKVKPRLASGELRLRQQALDYYDRMMKPWLFRKVLDVFDDWKKDLRTAMIAFVFTILTATVLRWLGY